MRALKKPKQEIDEYDNNKVIDKEQLEEPSLHEQEEALIALINHRNNEVEHLRRRISYYTTQLQEAEKRLSDTKMQLARLLEKSKQTSSRTFSENRTKSVKLEDESNSSQSCSPDDEAPSRSQFYSKTELLIPSTNPKVPEPTKPVAIASKSSLNTYSNSSRKVKLESPSVTKTSPDVEVIKIQDRGKKRKLEQKEHKNLVSVVCSNSSPCTIHCYTHSHIPSQHKRKMRSLVLCPVNEQLFATSALDGMVNLWQLQS